MLFYLLNSLHFLPSSILFSFASWYKVSRGCRWVVETRIYVTSIPFRFKQRHDSLTESRYPLRVISPPRWKRNDSSCCSSHKLTVGRREVNHRSSTSEMRRVLECFWQRQREHDDDDDDDYMVWSEFHSCIGELHSGNWNDDIASTNNNWAINCSKVLIWQKRF